MFKASKHVRKVVAAAVVASVAGTGIAQAGESSFSRAASALHSYSQRAAGGSGGSHGSSLQKYAQKAKSYGAQKLNQHASQGGQSNASSLQQSFKNKAKSYGAQKLNQASSHGAPSKASSLQQSFKNKLKGTMSQPGGAPSPLGSTAGNLGGKTSSKFSQLQAKLHQANTQQGGQGGKQGSGMMDKLKGKLEKHASGGKAASPNVPATGPNQPSGGLSSKLAQFKAKHADFLSGQPNKNNPQGGMAAKFKGKFASIAQKGLVPNVLDPGPPPSPFLPQPGPNGVVLNMPNPAFIEWQQKQAQFVEAQKNAGNGGGPALPGGAGGGPAIPGGNGGGPALPPVGNDGAGGMADNGGGMPAPPLPAPDNFGNAVQLASSILSAVRPAPVYVNDYAPPVIYAQPVEQYVEAPQAPVVLGSGSPDLVVEDLQFASPATLLAGPAYQLTFRNQGTAPAGGFRVGLYGVLNGAISEGSRAEVQVAGLAAGQSQVVTLRLPQGTTRLVGANGTSSFNQLAASVDLDNAVVESDKDNNVAVVDRATLETR